MGRARNPDREKALKLWLKSEPGTIKLADIAAKLKYSESTIRKWKCEDKWDEKRKENENKTPKKRGAQPGNRNAVGHGAPIGNQNAVGHGAPEGNQNRRVHGGYSKIFFDTLSKDEKKLIESMEPDEENLLIQEIQLLSVREHRIMKSISLYSEKAVYTSTAVRTEERRAFEDEKDKNEHDKRIQKKVDSGELLPGKAYRLQTTSEASYSIVLKLEEALTRCQSQKQRSIEALNKIRAAKTSNSTEVEDMYLIRRVVFGDGDDGGSNT